MKNYNQFPDRFVGYEVNRISCDFQDEEHFLKCLKDLEDEGIDVSQLYILHGPDGIKAFDPTGVEHGWMAVLSRKLHAIVSEAEELAINELVDDLENGMIHLSVPAKDLRLRDKVRGLMEEAEGKHKRYTDRFYVETYS